MCDISWLSHVYSFYAGHNPNYIEINILKHLSEIYSKKEIIREINKLSFSKNSIFVLQSKLNNKSKLDKIISSVVDIDKFGF